MSRYTGPCALCRATTTQVLWHRVGADPAHAHPVCGRCERAYAGRRTVLFAALCPPDAVTRCG